MSWIVAKVFLHGMYVPVSVSHSKPKVSIVNQEQFVESSRHSIAERCSLILCINGFHPQTNCHGFEAWHATCHDVITGSSSWKEQSLTWLD